MSDLIDIKIDNIVLEVQPEEDEDLSIYATRVFLCGKDITEWLKESILDEIDIETTSAVEKKREDDRLEIDIANYEKRI